MGTSLTGADESSHCFGDAVTTLIGQNNPILLFDWMKMGRIFVQYIFISNKWNIYGNELKTKLGTDRRPLTSVSKYLIKVSNYLFINFVSQISGQLRRPVFSLLIEQTSFDQPIKLNPSLVNPLGLKIFTMIISDRTCVRIRRRSGLNVLPVNNLTVNLCKKRI